MENKYCMIFFLFILSGCYVETEDPAFETSGYRPVYGTHEASEIKLASSKEIKSPGKIYIYGKYLLINEVNQGIHVYNNEDPTDPKPVTFIQMLGNTDMAIRNATLYADHAGNLVSVSFNNFNSLEVTGSLELNDWELGIPPPSGSYFQCIDPARGLVVGWEPVQLKNPDCHALY